VLLGVDAPHQGSVGDIYSSLTSYYYFKTNEAGGYAIRLTNTHTKLAFNAYSDQFVFASLLKDNGCGTSTDDPTQTGDKLCVYNLAPNTYYYIDTTDWSFTSDTYTITVNDVKSEGSLGAPVPIADGTSHAGMVDAGSSSYYAFTPSSSSAYTLAITNTNYSGYSLFNFTSLQIDTYTGADFSTGLLRTCTPYYGAIYCTVDGLTQGVPVYIKISEKNVTPSDTMFTVTPTKGIGEGSVANPVALAVGTPHAGGVDAGSNLFYQWCQNPSYSYYTFNTAAGAGGYTVSTDTTDSVRVELFRNYSSASVASCDASQGKPCMFSGIDPNSNYYLRVTNCNGTVEHYNIQVKKEGSEGSINNPVPLTLETSHAGAIGYYETSYFTFTTDRSGTYNIILDQALSWAYTSSPDFTGTGYSYGSTTANLDANKTYYLMVGNSSPGILLYNVKVTHGSSEGSIANPVSLPMGAPYSGKVGSQGRSYYTFKTRAAADYYVKFDNTTDLWGFGYYTPDFNNNGALTTACPSVPGPYVACTFENLAATSPYYLEVDERAGVNAFYNIYIYVLDYLAGCSPGSECYNFENGSTTPFTLTSTVSKGNVSQSLWKIDTTNNAATGGTKSLKSGTLAYSSTNPQSTCFSYTRAASAYSVLFSLMVNAPSSNTLEFSIDGTVQPNGAFYNMPAWKRVMFFPIPGQHTYKWCFNENYPYTTTPDSAWVDDIEFTNPLVLVNGLGASFATIQDAYTSAVANAISSPVLKAQAVTFNGPFTFDSAVEVTFKGGLDPTFTSTTGYSYLNGILTIVSGSLTAENVVVK
jgi:hypothetical protein